MTLFNWHKVALLFAGLALTANTWASESLSDVMKPSLEQGKNITNIDNKASLYRDYDKMAQDNLDQLAAIHKELRRILSQNYYDFPEQAAQVTELLNQLNAAKKAELEAQAASDKGDWESANAAAKKWEQAQAQAAESVSNTQMALKLKGAKQVIALKATEPMVNPFTVVSDGKTESLETTAPAVEPTLPITPVEEIQLDGATLYNEKGCVSCHGVDGKMPIMLLYPKLAGQNQDYALVQLKDIKSGARDNGQSIIMKGIMQGVNEEEM
ncbi:MAG: c-type cytochrome, partial [Candidatus Parabeggiatoa sp.]|nr:c-type cytochrome [Candidatus Parabeggiatoa sp.]